MKISKFSKTSTNNLSIISIISIAFILLLVSQQSPIWSTCLAVRLVRHSDSSQFYSTSVDNQQQQQQVRQSNLSPSNNSPVPYKTFYVSRACEWKSNLFVPKTNDILFAQQHQQSSHSQSQHANYYQDPSSPDTTLPIPVPIATTFNTAPNAARTNSPGNDYINSGPSGDLSTGASRTVLLSTDSRALVLALPLIQPSQTFAGYEPACSIRLIVPGNMRILAKLSSRRLTFAQEQQVEPSSFNFMGDRRFYSTDETGTGANTFSGLPRQQWLPQKSLWLNVSQNKFIETEQRIFETEGNVLALRFLLDRFANKHQPDLRFQLVLTAFQTLGENSDLSGFQQQVPNSQQIICDQQRLIAANLACDGFKNCQDGHDEEASTCALLYPARTTWTVLDNSTANLPAPPLIRGQQQVNESQTSWIWARAWNNYFATAQNKETDALVGFLVGFLLVLLLLCLCTCCGYSCFYLWRRYLRRRLRHTDPLARMRSSKSVASDDQQEAESLARAQNIENVARQQQRDKQMPARLQSILKRPSGGSSSRILLTTGRPMEAPPDIPRTVYSRDTTGRQHLGRGALASHHLLSPSSPSALSAAVANRADQTKARPADFKPTPAKRLTRPTRPVPVPVPLQLPALVRAVSPQASDGKQSSQAGLTTTTTSSSYSYSSVGTIRYSEHTSYYDSSSTAVRGQVASPSSQDANYSTGRQDSPRTSLI